MHLCRQGWGRLGFRVYPPPRKTQVHEAFAKACQFNGKPEVYGPLAECCGKVGAWGRRGGGAAGPAPTWPWPWP